MLVCCTNFYVLIILFIFKEADYSILITPDGIEDTGMETNNQLTEPDVKTEVLVHSNDTNETESKIFFVKRIFFSLGYKNAYDILQLLWIMLSYSCRLNTLFLDFKV